MAGQSRGSVEVLVQPLKLSLLAVAASAVVVPGVRPTSMSACLHQPRNVSGSDPTRGPRGARPRSTTDLAPARGPP